MDFTLPIESELTENKLPTLLSSLQHHLSWVCLSVYSSHLQDIIISFKIIEFYDTEKADSFLLLANVVLLLSDRLATATPLFYFTRFLKEYFNLFLVHSFLLADCDLYMHYFQFPVALTFIKWTKITTKPNPENPCWVSRNPPTPSSTKLLYLAC